MRKVCVCLLVLKLQELNCNRYEIDKNNLTATPFGCSSNFHFSKHGNSETEFSEYSFRNSIVACQCCNLHFRSNFGRNCFFNAKKTNNRRLEQEEELNHNLNRKL